LCIDGALQSGQRIMWSEATALKSGHRETKRLRK
jgi:hypothetical protein